MGHEDLNQLAAEVRARVDSLGMAGEELSNLCSRLAIAESGCMAATASAQNVKDEYVRKLADLSAREQAVAVREKNARRTDNLDQAEAKLARDIADFDAKQALALKGISNRETEISGREHILKVKENELTQREMNLKENEKNYQKEVQEKVAAKILDSLG